MTGAVAPNHLRALNLANDVKERRARFRRELRRQPERLARATLAAAITQMPDWLQGADVEKALKWCPRIGETTVGYYLQVIGVYQRRTLRELSDRQRRRLARLLLLHETDRR